MKSVIFLLFSIYLLNASPIKKSAPEHLIFVIPGIGNDGNYQLERITNDLKSKSVVVSKDLSMDEVYWEPIDWMSRFKTVEFQSKVECINLPTCSLFRALQNTYLADLLIYSHHSSKIKDFMLEAMNAAYEKFVQTWKDFSGSIAIYGYSLGGVVAYDLLANREALKKLKFQPNALFNVGAPVASFLVVRDQEFYPNALPSNIKFFNIFNPHDPLAYRLEPLMDLKMINFDPVRIQYPLKESWILSRLKSLYRSMLLAISRSDSESSAKSSKYMSNSTEFGKDEETSSKVKLQQRKRASFGNDIQDKKRLRLSSPLEHHSRMPQLYSLETDEVSVTGSDQDSSSPPIKDRIDFVLEESHVYPYLNSHFKGMFSHFTYSFDYSLIHFIFKNLKNQKLALKGK